ncbi:MAG: GAF domain-containing protein, partial [Anaerolineales bacterium]
AYLAQSKGKGFTLVASLGLDPVHEPETMDSGSLARRVAESRQAVRLEFTESADRIAEPYRSHGWIHHALAAPLIWRHEVIGVIELVAEADRRPFLEADLRLASLIAQQAASATGIARLIEAERRQRNMAEALQSASLALGRELEFDRVLDRVLDEVMRAIPCDAANLQDLQGDRSCVIRGLGYRRFGLDDRELASLDTLIGEARILQRMIAGETVVVPDTAKEPAWMLRPGFEWVRSWVGTPIRLGHSVLGFLNLESATPGAFDAESARLLGAFAAPAASAMHNARLYRLRIEENARLEIVRDIGRQLASTLDPSEILHRLLESACRVVGAQFGVALRAPRRAGSRPEERAWWPPQPPVPVLAAHPAMSELALEALRSGRLQVLTGEAQAPLFRAWGVPLSAGDRVWGAALLWTSGAGSGSKPGAEEILGPIGHLA